jgi:hypothetical protein
VNTDFEEDGLITQYLLGNLPPAEMERLDELSIADDNFAGRLQAVENDLVDAYVRGELEGQVLQRFQSAYLSSPVRREKVQFAQAFHTFADRQPRAPYSSQALPAGQRVRTVTPRRWWPFQMPVWQWGFAVATVLLTIAVGWLAVQNAEMRNQRDSALAAKKTSEEQARQIARQLAERSVAESKDASRASPGTATPFIVALNLAPPLRGGGDLPAIVLPPSADYLAIQLELESVGYPSYRADLKALPRRQSIWRSGSVASYRRNDGQIVNLTIPRRLLPPSVYVVELSGVNVRGTVDLAATYSFRISRE